MMTNDRHELATIRMMTFFAEEGPDVSEEREGRLEDSSGAASHPLPTASGVQNQLDRKTRRYRDGKRIADR